MNKIQKFNEVFYIVETREMIVERKLNVKELNINENELIDLITKSEIELLSVESLDYDEPEVYYTIYKKQNDELVYSDLSYIQLEEFIESL